MWSSKDLTLVIVLAVVSFTYSMLVAQLPTLITGIFGLNYIFLIGHVIFIAISFLLYDGRRWRFAFQSLLVALLFIPTNAVGTPFDILKVTPIIIVNTSADVVFNSVFQFFKNKQKLFWWVLLSNFFIHMLSPLLIVTNLYFFYNPELLNTFINVVTVLLPVIIIETIIGSFFGFKVFNRIIKNEVYNKS